MQYTMQKMIQKNAVAHSAAVTAAMQYTMQKMIQQNSVAFTHFFFDSGHPFATTAALQHDGGGGGGGVMCIRVTSAGPGSCQDQDRGHCGVQQQRPTALL